MLLIRHIAAAAEATGWMTVDSFRVLTHFRGTRNAHLVDPDGYNGRTGNFRERRIPLPPDAEVHGAFLTLSYCGHGTWAILEDHESLDELEDAILCPAGVLNGFTEFVLAFIDGELRRYEVRDEMDRVVAKDGMVVPGLNLSFTTRTGKYRVTWTG